MDDVERTRNRFFTLVLFFLFLNEFTNTHLSQGKWLFTIHLFKDLLFLVDTGSPNCSFTFFLKLKIPHASKRKMQKVYATMSKWPLACDSLLSVINTIRVTNEGRRKLFISIYSASKKTCRQFIGSLSAIQAFMCSNVVLKYRVIHNSANDCVKNWDSSPRENKCYKIIAVTSFKTQKATGNSFNNCPCK